MSTRRFSGVLLPVVGLVGLTYFVAAGHSQPAANAKKPLSTEDEIRELKRRADLADRRYAELLAKDQELESRVKAETKARVDTVVAQAALDRVPLGAMIPYFGAGDISPKGYVWADGVAAWPDADWVPKHLRQDEAGRPRSVLVPNMEKHLIGGTKDEVNVGRVWSQGKIKGQSVSISGTVSSSGASIVSPAAEFPTQNLLALVNPDGLSEKYTGPNSLTYKVISVPAYGSVQGSGTVDDRPLATAETNPRHVMCRWIIRVE